MNGFKELQCQERNHESPEVMKAVGPWVHQLRQIVCQIPFAGFNVWFRTQNQGGQLEENIWAATSLLRSIVILNTGWDDGEKALKLSSAKSVNREVLVFCRSRTSSTSATIPKRAEAQ